MDSSRHTPVTVLITAIAVVFAVLYLVYFLTIRNVTDVSQVQAFFEMTLFGVAVVVLFGSVWLVLAIDARPRHERRLLWWAAGGACFLVFIKLSMLFVVSPAPDLEDTLLQLLLSGGFGISAGLVMGVLEIRASRQERARARSELKARQRKEERERLRLLNQYLRHEILNKVQVISMNAELLLDHEDGAHSDAERLTTIKQRSDDVARFISSIRSILQASDHDPELEPVDVGPLLHSEVEKLRRGFGHVHVETDIPDQSLVKADPHLDSVFSNLLENAAQHGGQEPTITVTVSRTEKSVVVAIADDGPGIPPEERDRLFDPPETGDHGYGLFLARNLVELYGGTLRLEETGPDGTTFVVELLRADHPPVEVTSGPRIPA